MRNRKSNFLELSWSCAICWFLLTGQAWTELFSLGNFKLLYLVDFFLFFSCLTFIATLKEEFFNYALLLQITDWLILLPNSPNHRWVFTFASIIFFISKLKNLNVETFAKYICLLLSVVYFFSGFAKLNSDFLASDHSCALNFINQAKFIYLLPNYLKSILPFIICLTELLLSIFLINNRTRIPACLVSLAFHLFLAFNTEKHFLDFSSVMSALILSQFRFKYISPNKSLIFRLLTALTFISLAFYRDHTLNMKNNYYDYLFVIWLLYYGLTIAILYSQSIKNIIQWRLITNSNRTLRFLICISILNGLSPYLGLKTRTSFSMYSNLWINNKTSNHYLIPRSLDCLTLIGDEAKIISVNDIFYLDSLIGEKIPYIQLYNYLIENPYINVEFERKNKKISYPNSALEKPNAIFNNYISRKLLIFQTNSANAAKECIW